ncbi:MAG: D-alanyl-D-alanine carboxypeptidase family protein [Chthoniobacterales bacterium]
MKYLPLILIPALLAGCATAPPAQVMRAGPAAAPVAAAPSQAPVWPANAPALQAQSAILIDAQTGEVIFQKNADQQRPVASTQKLLTALLIVGRGNLDAVLTIRPEDTRVEPTKLGLRPGERYTRRSLLEVIMVKSCNDACTALARDHSGSDATFASLMNQAAWSLGARHSHFLNSHGLPAPEYSTARDMARIAFAAYRQPELRRMMRVQQLAFRHNSGKMTVLKATNKLLARSPAFTGMKTGYTEAAGRCLVSSGRVGGREVILVQLGSKTKNIFDDAQRVMAWSPQSSYYLPVAAYGAAERSL